MSTLKVNTIQDASGNNGTTPALLYNGTAKAWVNFNGTGTVAIRASYNVTSITDNGVGDYTVNFTNAMTDANYAIAGIAQVDTGGADGTADVGINIRRTAGAAASTSARIATYSFAGGATDPVIVTCSVIR